MQSVKLLKGFILKDEAYIRIVVVVDATLSIVIFPAPKELGCKPQVSKHGLPDLHQDDVVRAVPCWELTCQDDKTSDAGG
jgi:hypothetical protein